jgi:hypothetical protein
MGKQIPPDKEGSFTNKIHVLLVEHGWYFNGGWRETSDHDRGYRVGISEAMVVDELIRRDWSAYEFDTRSN